LSLPHGRVDNLIISTRVDDTDTIADDDTPQQHPLIGLEIDVLARRVFLEIAMSVLVRRLWERLVSV
jgi:hypothetical protein